MTIDIKGCVMVTSSSITAKVKSLQSAGFSDPEIDRILSEQTARPSNQKFSVNGDIEPALLEKILREEGVSEADIANELKKQAHNKQVDEVFVFTKKYIALLVLIAAIFFVFVAGSILTHGTESSSTIGTIGIIFLAAGIICSHLKFWPFAIKKAEVFFKG